MLEFAKVWGNEILWGVEAILFLSGKFHCRVSDEKLVVSTYGVIKVAFNISDTILRGRLIKQKSSCEYLSSANGL